MGCFHTQHFSLKKVLKANESHGGQLLPIDLIQPPPIWQRSPITLCRVLLLGKPKCSMLCNEVSQIVNLQPVLERRASLSLRHSSPRLLQSQQLLGDHASFPQFLFSMLAYSWSLSPVIEVWGSFAEAWELERKRGSQFGAQNFYKIIVSTACLWQRKFLQKAADMVLKAWASDAVNLVSSSAPTITTYMWFSSGDFTVSEK